MSTTETSAGISAIRMVALHDADDAKCVDALELHLTPALRAQLVSLWHHRHIRPGDDVDGATNDALRSAHMVLLFISPRFNQRYFDRLASFLGSDEMGRRRIVPIYTRPCNWRNMPFAQLQCLPRDGQPVMRDGRVTEERARMLAEELLQLVAYEKSRIDRDVADTAGSPGASGSLIGQMKELVVLEQRGADRDDQVPSHLRPLVQEVVDADEPAEESSGTARLPAVATKPGAQSTKNMVSSAGSTMAPDVALELKGLRERVTHLNQELTRVQEENRRAFEWLDASERESEWFRSELDRRPRVRRETYKILTLGISGVGKTALTLKWSNPLVDFGTLRATKFERYERTASRVVSRGGAVDYVFQFSDRGGEYVVDAQHEIVTQGVDAIVFVVDVGTTETGTVDQERIRQQLAEFHPGVLKFILTPGVLAICRTLVLFINKSDLLSGNLPEVDAEGRNLYATLIGDLEKFRDKVDVAVFVGSAIHGHSTHALFSHLVRRILPPGAYGSELLQGTTG